MTRKGLQLLALTKMDRKSQKSEAWKYQFKGTDRINNDQKVIHRQEILPSCFLLYRV